jgi:peptidoglycan/xylan/chitin deacetylase (PgdA/CDA1 family)
MEETSRLRQFVTVFFLLAVLTSTAATAALVPTHDAAARSTSSANTDATAADEWTEYQSIVIFRNDDPKPKWDLSTLKAVNQIFIEENVPITHGVIPADSSGVSHQRNGQFCQYIRDVKDTHPEIIEYAQHGYSHEAITNFQGGSSEFAKLSRSQQRKRITTGKQYYEKCVDKEPTVFIPPYNTYDTTTVDVLNSQGYTTVSGGPIVSDYFGESGVFTRSGLQHVMQSQGMIEQWKPEVRIYDTPALKNMFDQRYEDGELYIQMMHYPHFDTQEERGRLRSLIQYMKGKDVRFMKLGEFASARASGDVERTANGWRVRESTDGGDDNDGSDGDDGDNGGDDDDSPDQPEKTPQFDVGQAVHAASDVNVRETPNGARAGTATGGTDATITGGPTRAGGYIWYQLEYEDGLTGWSVQKYLADGHTDDGDEGDSPDQPEKTPQFDVGEAVHATTGVNVRETPNGARVGTATSGTDATITDGPTRVGGYIWYRLQYEDGLTGWSVQKYLAAGHTRDPNQPPTPVIGVPSTIERGETVTLDGSLSSDDGTITSYSWYVGDTQIGSGETIKQNYVSVGQRSITLRVTDDDGATASTTETFFVKEPDGDGGNGRFNIGDKVTTVTQTELRITPNPDGVKLLTLVPGRDATITQGPINTEGIVWYEIELQSGVSGYIRGSTLQQQ